MTDTDSKTLAAMMEISIKLDRINENMDQMNKSLIYLCQCEDMKKREKIQKETAMHENIEAMKKDMEKRREEFAKKFETPIFK